MGNNNAFELGVPWSDTHLTPIQAQTEPDDYSDFPGMETPFSIPLEVPGVVNALYDKDWFAFMPDETGLGLSLSQSAGNCAHVYETRWFLFTEYENISVNTTSMPWVDNQTYARFCTLCHEPQLSKAPYAGQ